MDSRTHRTIRADGTCPYPDNDHIIGQLGETGRLVVAGFHIWDCVEKLARRAYERGIDTLVDEDLTEFFSQRVIKNDLNYSRFPSYNPKKELKGYFLEVFLEARNKPWYFNDY